MSSDTKRSAILLRRKCMSMVDERSNPNRNGVFGHSFLPLHHRNKQVGDLKMILFVREGVGLPTP